MIYSRRDRDKVVPMIRHNGNACDRAKRQAIQTVAVAMFVVVALLLMSQGALDRSNSIHLPRHYTEGARVQLSPNVRRSTQAPDPVEHRGDAVVQNPPPLSPDDACSVDRREVILGISSGSELPAVGSPNFPTPDHTKAHFDALMALLHDPKRIACWQKQRAMVASRHTTTSEKFFFDLGSRSMDQTRGFLRAYPQASQFVLVCYEANPKFNNVYSTFVASQKHTHVPAAALEHHNEAVGVEEGKLVLSDQDVGSSIVRDAASQQRSRAPGDVEVTVVDFSSRMADRVGSIAAESGIHLVVKMDIEKMEFAVLHRMLLSGALLLVDELLLECHYNTNLSRERRDATKHIGLDDCRDLVAALNTAFGGVPNNNGHRAFEAVLWNSVKTARTSGYSERHGGFKPS